MILFEKIKEAAVSVVPIMILVWALHLTVAPLGANFLNFIVGGILLILGLAIFLLGADIGLVPIGKRVGSALTQRRNLPLLLGSGFIIGFFITIAEPDVRALAQQISAVNPAIKSEILVPVIGAGVGLFVSVALARIVFGVSLRLGLFVFYLLIFACAVFTEADFLGIAFDAGGATTGPMSVPFIMALGIGVTAVRANAAKDDSFGLIGIASIGPILAALVFGVFSSGGQTPPAEELTREGATIWGHFLSFVPEVCEEVAMALAPLAGLFVAFRLFLLRNATVFRMIRASVGLVYVFIGLTLFFMGVKGGFIPAGGSLGATLAALDSVLVIFAVAFVLGALAVCAEPAVWVLTHQVENVSGGAIKSRLILAFLCVGVACAVALAIGRAGFGLSLWYFLAPGYALTFILTRYCPPMFSAIAFDSGGVASGPMASTFILAFAIGAAGKFGNGASMAFGTIALIAMTPLIAIQILGIIYAYKTGAFKNKGKA